MTSENLYGVLVSQFPHLRNGDDLNPAHKPNPVHHLFLIHPQVKKGFTFLNGWKKSKEYFVTHENYMKFKILVTKNKVLLEHSYPHTTASLLPQRNGDIVRQQGP